VTPLLLSNFQPGSLPRRGNLSESQFLKPVKDKRGRGKIWRRKGTLANCPGIPLGGLEWLASTSATSSRTGEKKITGGSGSDKEGHSVKWHVIDSEGRICRKLCRVKGLSALCVGGSGNRGKASREERELSDSYRKHPFRNRLNVPTTLIPQEYLLSLGGKPLGASREKGATREDNRKEIKSSFAVILRMKESGSGSVSSRNRSHLKIRKRPKKKQHEGVIHETDSVSPGTWDTPLLVEK